MECSAVQCSANFCILAIIPTQVLGLSHDAQRILIPPPVHMLFGDCSPYNSPTGSFCHLKFTSLH